MAEAVEILPPSWEYPEATCARITLGEREFWSRNFREAPWRQTAEIRAHGRIVGMVEIAYLHEQPQRDEGPFTLEERKLLNAVAERLGRVVERLNAEERLREKEAELRARMTHLTRVSTMGEMASSIAHEVNQPLTAVATYAQACTRLVRAGAASDPDVLDVLDRIGKEALRAGNIIHRLRLLVRRRTSEPTSCDLVRLLKEISPLATGDARLHDVQLQFELPPSLPSVRADGIQIQQVLLNLIRNGIDAMEETPTGERILEVEAGTEETDVRISVRDRGCGLLEESESALFEPFFTTKEGGMGMGLSISRSIVTAHGGRLWFERNAEAGTTFHLSLPFEGDVSDV